MIPYGRQDINAADIEAVISVLNSDYLTQGPQAPLFEANICRETQANFAVAGNSATSMLHAACLALGVGKGDIVWTSPITFVASANCALYCGADVDFVDVDPSTANMCPVALEKKLLEAARLGILPKVIIPVHMAGHSCDMQAVSKLVKPYGIKIIEDAAHAIGGHYADMPIGSCQFSDITVFSFHPVKIITTAEGGVATTNCLQLSQAMQSYRSHGITKSADEMLRPDEGDWYYEQHNLGFNYRMTDLQAGLGNSQITRLSEFVDKRNQLAKRYELLLNKLDIKFIQPLNHCHSAYHLFIVRLPANIDRKSVFNLMRLAGICVHVHYFPVYLQPFYLQKGFLPGHCPGAEAYYSHCLTLPLYTELTESEQDFIVSNLTDILSLIK
ncbi:UDP-4-amino-4,6-dideoxy-N-acetyl-beta-L-altrosamine transaminase [Shewanella sp. HL-SH8]|uniref:UDP-4-amino-4, 6-dideoxy-N-acetyl-beta-L-altrosamine transaminase n=1 Tax=Shewanella sp. HL-SH8 TaxID=3436242 RepID=UPI003EBCA981